MGFLSTPGPLIDELLPEPEGPSLEETIAALPAGLADLLRSRRLFTNVRWQDYVEDGEVDRVDIYDLEDAEAASSQLAIDTNQHAIMFDIDVPATLDDGLFRAGDFTWSTKPAPAWLIPSSTEGHSHLYVHCNLPWSMVLRILKQFAHAGVVEQGYLQVSEKRGFTALRLPWIHKEDTGG